MDADSFITYFYDLTKYSNKIDVGYFFNSYFSSTTPIKMKMNYSGNVQDCVRQARNCIISNLYLNAYFEKKTYDRESIQPIITLLKDCKENSSDDQQAQIFFLLDLSKAKFDCTKFRYFELLFSDLLTIKLTSSKFETEFNTVFNCLKNNEQIKNIIRKVVKDISGQEQDFEFNSCKVAYFKSSINGLNGFAGLETIYVSETEQQNLYLASKLYSNGEKLIILKCNFIRLILHETTHIALRRLLNDFNFSSPKKHESNSQKSIEAGIIAEMELFNARIDWIKSAMGSKFNLTCCFHFLESLLENKQVKFEVELSGVELKDSPVSVMAVDLEFDIGKERFPYITFE